jgi:hypothetical protein
MPKLVITVLLAVLSCGAQAANATLKPFASEAELAALLESWAEAHKRRRAERRLSGAQEAAAPAALASKSEDSVTNAQHAGVDEGGIVKLHGEHLVILRRGRLFTVGIHALDPVSAVDAFGPDVDPRGAWYDEMLIWQDTVVVIGYSYARGGTEIALFDISADGRLAYRATHHLRSNDYYSSRNYASRLIGSKLVFYTPLYLNPRAPYASLPAMRKWGAGDFQRITPATRIYRSDEPLDPLRGVALHSVSVCDLAQRELQCEGSAVLGPAGRVFYVSPGSVFVWTANSAVFRMPLDGGAPSALKVSGTPIDQFSFLEDAGGFLNVLVRSHARGEAMWSSERSHGRLALLRVPLASFSDGRDSAPRRAYRSLPNPGGHALQNRFVGDYLVYGSGAGWRRPLVTTFQLAYALKYRSDDGTYELPLVHGVDRIEALGEDAVVIGSDGQDLHFTSLRLGASPETAGRYTRPNANQGETRSHGFFYSPKAGVLGLPIIGGRQRASRHLWHESASILYLNAKFQELGTLDSQPAYGADGCRASCVDWYGNSRPLFLGGRVLALMGYEIVEGALRGPRIEELRRVNFSPAGRVRDMIPPP